MKKSKDRWGYYYTKAIFEYLKPFAARCEKVFYKAVAETFGTSERALGGRELTAIQGECKKHCWPHLNALVVTKKKRLPGDAYQPFNHPVTKSEFEQINQEICDFDWTDKHL